jgi:hypothetical protein
VFFEYADETAIAGGIEQLLRASWDADGIREHAQAFSEQRFIERIRAVVAEELERC